MSEPLDGVLVPDPVAQIRYEDEIPE